MFRDDYKKELDSFVLSEEFKEQTVRLMMEKAQNPQTAPKKTVVFPKKSLVNIAAACFVLVVAVFGSGFISQQFKTESCDQSAETMPNNFPVTEKDNQSDGLTTETANENINGVFNQVYTYSIADSRELDNQYRQADVAGSELKKNKVVLSFDNSGGMGFEAYIIKDAYELEQNSAYTVGDEFSSLPVYSPYRPAAHRLTEYITDNLDKLGFSYGPFTYKWSYPVYDNEGHHISNGQEETDSATPPSDIHYIYEIKADITDKNGTTGKVELSCGRGQMRIILDKFVSDSDNGKDIALRFVSQYPQAFGESRNILTTFDYNIYGEVGENSFVYNQSKDYGENIFNSTANNSSIIQYTPNDVNTTLARFPVSLYWNKEGDLPAIDYAQALGLLYDGVYYSNYLGEITDDTKVSHIELVYKQGDYNMYFDRYDGNCLPFYKFYVDITDKENFDRNNNGLKTYAAYYVCAIHPDFIRIDENSNYAQFN